MDAIKLHQLQQSFADSAKEAYNPKTKTKGVKAVGLYWDAAANEVRIRIMEEIYGGYTAERVFEGLGYAKEYGLDSRIELFSAGGDLYAAIAVYDYIKQQAMEVKCDIYGYAMSAATVISSACAEINIGMNSAYMIHRATGGTKESNAKANTAVENIYIAKTGKSREEIGEMLDANKGEGTFMTADEALQMGFVTNISGADDTEVVGAIAAHFNFTTNKTKDMSVINWLKDRFKMKADANDSPEFLEEVKAVIGETDEQPEPVAPVETPAPAADPLAEIQASMKLLFEQAQADRLQIEALHKQIAEGLINDPQAPAPSGGGHFRASVTDSVQAQKQAEWQANMDAALKEAKKKR